MAHETDSRKTKSLFPRFYLGLGLLSLLASGQVLACAVCGVPPDQTSDVFVASTVVLSLVPLGAIGGFVYLLIQRLK